MKRFIALVSTLAMGLSLSACNLAAGDTIKIGAILPLTGDAAALGKDMLNGAKMAVDEINAKGGIGGKQVELIAEDGRCTGPEAASAAQKLVNIDKVQAIVGGLCSSETLAAAPIAEAGKVVMVSPGSSSPNVTNAGLFIFRDYPSDALRSVAMAKYFAEKGYKKIAIIAENTDYATALRDAVVKQVGAANVVFNETVEPGTKDFRSLFTRLKGVNYDVFFPDGQSDATNGVMVSQYLEAGLTKPMIGADTSDSLTMIELTGGAVDGMELIDVPSSGEGKPFEADFIAKNGKPVSSVVWAAHGYDAAGVILKAMKNGATDGEAIRVWLNGMEPYKGVIGTFSFDKNGDVTGVGYVLKQFKDGKIVTIKPISLE